MMKKHMKKKWQILGVLLLAAAFLLPACGTTATEEVAEPQTVKIAAFAGPTGMGMSPMIANGVDLGEGVETEFTIATAPDQVTQDIISGNYQIASLPVNLAATLYNKTEGAVILGAVNTLNVLDIVADQAAEIEQVSDLKGKTIVAFGQGGTSEYVLDYVLEANGLTPGTDVNIEWEAETTTVVAKMISGEATIALLPQPFATQAIMKSPNATIALDLGEAFKQASGTDVQTGCIVVQKEWAENNKPIVKAFMEAYEDSVDIINKDDDAAAQTIVDAGVLGDADLAKAAIPNCGIVYEPADQAQDSLNTYYGILFDSNPQSIGGTVPDDVFYSLDYE